MSRNGTYADYLAVSAAAVIVNKNILIHELGKKPLFIPGSYYIDDQLHICYYPDKLHYNSVVDAIGNTAILPSEAIEINTNLDDLNETMNIDLTDILTVSTIIDDVGDVTEEKSCSIRRQNMIPLISKPNLIKCVNCKKIMVINKDKMQISMAFEIGDGNKLTFRTMKGLLKNFIQQQRPDERMNNEDISEILLLQGPWKMTLSVFRRQVLALTKD
ncbi:unnamed protein product [Rotaria magnacalcarata]|uniref:Uncharacterized protein n=1 Tax=Rotaria magnacalcarata TaxID=392030 RepID=A0A816SJ02_9BILA|nr:unnamed protein product [Rotaria magnacalcarata]